jgi:hypothetical protein
MVWRIQPEEMNGVAAPEPTEASALTPQSLLEWRFSLVFGDHGAGEDIQDGTSLLLFSLHLVS